MDDEIRKLIDEAKEDLQSEFQQFGEETVFRDHNHSFEQVIDHELRKQDLVYELFLNSHFGHIITKQNGEIVNINNTMLDLLGFSGRGEIKGINIDTLIHPDDLHPDEAFKVLVKDLKKGSKFYNLRLRHKDGSYIRCRVSVGAVKGEKTATYYLGYIRIPDDSEEAVH